MPDRQRCRPVARSGMTMFKGASRHLLSPAGRPLNARPAKLPDALRYRIFGRSHRLLYEMRHPIGRG